MEEKIRNFEAEVRDLLDELNYIKEELKNKEKQETKQHKSLSNYRIYKPLMTEERYKCIASGSEIRLLKWNNVKFDLECLKAGNVYSENTPNELLEREIKKRQLWFNLEKYLKEKGCLATNEDWKNDYSEGEKSKYYPIYDIEDNKIRIHFSTIFKMNKICSTNEETLKDYMNTLTNEDIKIMFDVE